MTTRGELEELAEDAIRATGALQTALNRRLAREAPDSDAWKSIDRSARFAEQASALANDAALSLNWGEVARRARERPMAEFTVGDAVEWTEGEGQSWEHVEWGVINAIGPAVGSQGLSANIDLKEGAYAGPGTTSVVHTSRLRPRSGTSSSQSPPAPSPGMMRGEPAPLHGAKVTGLGIGDPREVYTLVHQYDDQYVAVDAQGVQLMRESEQAWRRYLVDPPILGPRSRRVSEVSPGPPGPGDRPARGSAGWLRSRNEPR